VRDLRGLVGAGTPTAETGACSMTTTLTPAEQAEVTRFGIHDEDILRDLEGRWDDEIPCGAKKCETAATVQVSSRCCGRCMFMCSRHLVKMIALTQRDLSAPKGADCKSCGTFFPSGTRFD